jgi:hypothetical protein
LPAARAPRAASRRAAEQRDERAPFQLTKLHPLPLSQGGQHNGLASLKSGRAAVRDFGPAKDRNGSQGGMPVVSLEWQKTLKYLTEALQQ